MQAVSNIIIYLPLRDDDIRKIEAETSFPQPYDPHGSYESATNTAGSSGGNGSLNGGGSGGGSGGEQVVPVVPERLITEKIVDSSFAVDDQDDGMVERNLRLMMSDFVDANMRGEYITNTDIWCWHCCHPFDHVPPCGIPMKYVDGKFHLYGCFCSFNCAAAYIFDKKMDTRWENYSLLNLLYRKVFNCPQKKIVPAPPKEVLKVFGGVMTIEEYRRNLISNLKAYRIITPPMISIVPKLEENVSYAKQVRERRKYIPVNQSEQQANLEKLLEIKEQEKAKEKVAVKGTLNAFIKVKKAGKV